MPPKTMPSFPQEFTNNHVLSSHNVSKLYGNHDRSKMINFGTQFRLYGDHGGLNDFRAHNGGESGVSSPPLWHTSPPKSPSTETSPLQSHIYNHHHFNPRSPTSRSDAIAQGKDELMEMINSMPESSYELSLKDLVLVDHSKIIGNGQTKVAVCEEIKDYNTTKSGNKKKTTPGKRQMLRSRSKNGPVLLKIFVPALGHGNKKSSTMSTSAKVSPKPVEGDKFVDKDWWKKRLSDIRETDGSGSSAGSSGSNNSTRRRNKGNFLAGCFSFLKNKNRKTKKQKDNRF